MTPANMGAVIGLTFESPKGVYGNKSEQQASLDKVGTIPILLDVPCSRGMIPRTIKVAPSFFTKRTCIGETAVSPTKLMAYNTSKET